MIPDHPFPRVVVCGQCMPELLCTLTHSVCCLPVMDYTPVANVAVSAVMEECSVILSTRHRECTGMSKVAYDLLTAEDSAEWACDDCISTKTIPTVKMVSKT